MEAIVVVVVGYGGGSGGDYDSGDRIATTFFGLRLLSAYSVASPIARYVEREKRNLLTKGKPMKCTYSREL